MERVGIDRPQRKHARGRKASATGAYPSARKILDWDTNYEFAFIKRSCEGRTGRRLVLSEFGKSRVRCGNEFHVGVHCSLAQHSKRDAGYRAQPIACGPKDRAALQQDDMSFKQKVWINGPPLWNQVNAAVRDAALDRAEELGVVGVRASLSGYMWFWPPGDLSPIDFTAYVADYVTECKDRGLRLHILFYFNPDPTPEWVDLYGGSDWGDDPGDDLPNILRPPAGTATAVWAEIKNQLQVLLDTANTEWGTISPGGLTFEFCNEPACGGAFGVSPGVPIVVGGGTEHPAVEGEIDDAFHDLAEYLLVTNPLDFHGHALYAPSLAGFKNLAQLTTQNTTMFTSGYTYRDLFDSYSMNIYPRIEGYHMTGHVACANDANERALQQLDRLRAITEVGSKPIAIQETGVSGFIGGFTELSSNTVIFARPFYLQELGRYLGATVVSLCSLGVERVTAFSLYNPYEGADDRYFSEAGYSLMQNVIGDDPQEDIYRISLLWFGKWMSVSYDKDDPPGSQPWVMMTNELPVEPF